MHYQENEVIKKLPAHLKQFINNQDYDAYTPINQAVWRYVMRQNVSYLQHVAHGSYLDGLKKTGISLEKIPSMYGMNRILKDIGWAAVAVDGFIPPSAFMEFQAYNVLVIAEDMRQIGNIEYTPAPDIIHEAAGHAPIIANPEYSEYLRRFGEIGCKAISSSKDYELYEAVRHLSIIKEDSNCTPAQIKEAEEHLQQVQSNMGKPSEMSKIRNLHWWTVEYGLIGTVQDPKIYGAGLLSSIGESKWCMKPEVKKIPYTIDAAYMEFDITKPQPQLFVTPNFAHLSFVLEQFANQMALRRGEIQGVHLLIESQQLGTIELNTGIQISGVFTEVIADEYNRPIYIKTTGETALSYRDKELIGHGTSTHKEGYGTPLGKLKYTNMSIENMSPFDLDAFNIKEGGVTKLEFEGDISVEGEVITGVRSRMGKVILVSFKNCTVKHQDHILFHPDWGVYDMAIGSEVISAFAGPADVSSFDMITHVPTEKTHKATIHPQLLNLQQLYQTVRDLREGDQFQESDLNLVLQQLKQNPMQEHWLIALELKELAMAKSYRTDSIQAYIQALQQQYPDIKSLIDNGLKLITEELV